MDNSKYYNNIKFIFEDLIAKKLTYKFFSFYLLHKKKQIKKIPYSNFYYLAFVIAKSEVHFTDRDVCER